MSKKKWNIEDMIGGWFIGNFTPSVIRTKDFEVSYKFHPKGEDWAKHYHKVATEVTFLIRGRLKINDIIYFAGDIWIQEPNEIADPEFLEDCELIAVKIPSVMGDKYEVPR